MKDLYASGLASIIFKEGLNKEIQIDLSDGVNNENHGINDKGNYREFPDKY